MLIDDLFITRKIRWPILLELSSAIIVLAFLNAIIFLVPFSEKIRNIIPIQKSRSKKHLHIKVAIFGLIIVMAVVAFARIADLPEHKTIIIAIVAFLVIIVLPLLITGKSKIHNGLRTSMMLSAILLNIYLIFYLYAFGNSLNTSNDLSHERILLIFLIGLASLGLIAFTMVFPPDTSFKNVPFFDSLQERISGGDLLTAILVSAVLTISYELYMIDAHINSSVADTNFLHQITFNRSIIPLVCLLLFFIAGHLLWAKAIGLFRLQFELDRENGSSFILNFVTELKTLDQYSERSIAQDRQINLVDMIADQGFILVKQISWAIPTLGFIGTVYGLSDSIAQLSGVMLNDGATSNQSLGLRSDLANAMQPISIAFDTTLVALPLGLIISLLLALSARWQTALFARLDYVLAQTTKNIKV